MLVVQTYLENNELQRAVEEYIMESFFSFFVYENKQNNDQMNKDRAYHES